MTKLAAALALTLLAALPARADNVGNVTLSASGTCHAVGGILPLRVEQIPAATPDTTIFRLTLLATLAGTAQPQYLVVKLTQAGKAATGPAQVFNNGFLAANGPFLNGSWSGSFPAINAVATIDVGKLTVTAGTGAATCTLMFSNGQAVF